jgi:hypothetical protein
LNPRPTLAGADTISLAALAIFRKNNNLIGIGLAIFGGGLTIFEDSEGV